MCHLFETIETMTILLEQILPLMIGFVLGILASTIASFILAYVQFKNSIAIERLNQVINATHEIISYHYSQVRNPQPTFIANFKKQMLRNKYRYSLGVLIDRIVMAYGDNNLLTKSDKKYPNFLCMDKKPDSVKHEDRWKDFMHYVKPVIDEVNSFTFLGNLLFLKKKKTLRQLQCLNSLGMQIEIITGISDSCLAQMKGNHIRPALHAEDDSIEFLDITIEEQENENILKNLREQYSKLESIWNQWLELTKKKST